MRCFGSRSPASMSQPPLWALILQSLPCRHVTFTAFLFIVTPTGCRRPPVLTSVLMLRWDTPLVCYCAAALHASSFDLLCYSFYKCAFSFCCCCCGVFSFDLIFRVVSCVMYFISFLGGGFFLLCQRFLGIFLRARTFQYWCFFFLLVFNIPNRLMFFVFPPGMGVLPGRVDLESSHGTSMVTTHVDHVVGLSVLHISQVSSLGQNVINLFFFLETRRTSVYAASS